MNSFTIDRIGVVMVLVGPPANCLVYTIAGREVPVAGPAFTLPAELVFGCGNGYIELLSRQQIR